MPMPVFDENNKNHTIEIDEVFSMYKKVKERRIIVTSQCGEFYIPSTIDQIGVILEPLGFCQIDKNRIINVDRVKEYKSGVVHVDGEFYTVSRRNRKKLKEMIENRSHTTNGHFSST